MSEPTLEFDVELRPEDLPRIMAWFAVRKRDYWIMSGLLWLIGVCAGLLWLYYPRLAFSNLATGSLVAMPLVHMLGVPFTQYATGRSAFLRLPEYERRYHCRLDADTFVISNSKRSTSIARDILCAAELRDAFLIGPNNGCGLPFQSGPSKRQRTSRCFAPGCASRAEADTEA